MWAGLLAPGTLVVSAGTTLPQSECAITHAHGRADEACSSGQVGDGEVG